MVQTLLIILLPWVSKVRLLHECFSHPHRGIPINLSKIQFSICHHISPNSIWSELCCKSFASSHTCELFRLHFHAAKAAASWAAWFGAFFARQNMCPEFKLPASVSAGSICLGREGYWVLDCPGGILQQEALLFVLCSWYIHKGTN